MCCRALDPVIKMTRPSFIVLYSIQAYMVTNGLQINIDNLDQGPVLSYTSLAPNAVPQPRTESSFKHRSLEDSLSCPRSIIEALRHSDYSRSHLRRRCVGLCPPGRPTGLTSRKRIPQRGLSAHCSTRSYSPARRPLALAQSTPWNLADTLGGPAHPIPRRQSSHR